MISKGSGPVDKKSAFEMTYQKKTAIYRNYILSKLIAIDDRNFQYI